MVPAPKDGILLYEKDLNNHHFKVVQHVSGSSFQPNSIASFLQNQSGGITNFDIKESAWFVNNFNGAGNKQVMVFDDQSDTPRFVRFDTATSVTGFSLTGDGTTGNDAVIKKDMFKSGAGATNRTERDKFRFFAGHFTTATNSPAQVLIVDMRTAPHKYYLGTLGSGVIDFKLLATSGSVDLPSGTGEEFGEFGNTVPLQNLGEQIFYVTRANGQAQFHRVNITNSTSPTVSLVHYNAFAADFGFAWEFDHLQRPLLTGGLDTAPGNSTTGAKLTAVSFTGQNGYAMLPISISDTAFVDTAIDRSDLYQSIYPFQWLQGDYNGDGKTDIGFFHMKEPKWYFANTSGTVPDLVGKVENGNAGEYFFEYANSSSFDNTGGDGIYDLPMNYKVCTKLIVRDGQGSEYQNTYTYKNGFAFSTFINGKKETDFFGFSDFTSIDAMGSQTVNKYNTTLYGTANFDAIMLNRALAGALAESTFNGWDHHEYSRTTTTYQIKTIQPAGAGKSYLVAADKTEKFVQGIKTQTTQKVFQVPATAFQVDKTTETSIDHYADAAHPSVTLTNETNFETIAATNQQRATSQVSLKSTPQEVTTTTSYDARGNAAQTIRHYSGSGLATVADRVTEYQYDNFGNRVVQTDVSATPARRSEFVYDSVLMQYVAEEKMIGDAL
jgi:hypothetical protein